MNCAEYAPLISRYLDEDLEGKDLEAFLAHLGQCAECRKDLEQMDRLRGWLQAADAHLGIPEIRGEWGLEDLLRLEASLEANDCAEPLSQRAGEGASAQDRTRARSKAWIKRYLFPFPLVPAHMLRFALPLLVAGVAATWLYTRMTSNWIDVHELQTVPATTATFPQAEDDQIDYYVVQHATHQPWEQYGDEVPMLQLASMPSR